MFPETWSCNYFPTLNKSQKIKMKGLLHFQEIYYYLLRAEFQALKRAGVRKFLKSVLPKAEPLKTAFCTFRTKIKEHSMGY